MLDGRLRRGGKKMEEDYLIIDCSCFHSFQSFIDYMNSIAFTKSKWNGNLDAFNDYLVGGFGNEIESRSIKIINSQEGKNALGKEETEIWLKEKKKTCHPSNIQFFETEINNLYYDRAQLLWDKIVEIIKDHSQNFSKDKLAEIPKLVIQ